MWGVAWLWGVSKGGACSLDVQWVASFMHLCLLWVIGRRMARYQPRSNVHQTRNSWVQTDSCQYVGYCRKITEPNPAKFPIIRLEKEKRGKGRRMAAFHRIGQHDNCYSNQWRCSRFVLFSRKDMMNMYMMTNNAALHIGVITSNARTDLEEASPESFSDGCPSLLFLATCGHAGMF